MISRWEFALGLSAAATNLVDTLAKEYMMRLRFEDYALLTICLLGPMGLMAENATWNKKTREVVEMRQVLKADGAYNFVRAGNLFDWIPRIHSQAWVDRIPDDEPERRVYEQEVREFGYDFLLSMKTMAKQQVALTDIEAIQARASAFLELSKWLKREKGYGNYILKNWAEQLAISCMGALVVNPEADTNCVMKLLSGLDDRQKDVDFRMAILGEEGPHSFERPDAKGENEIFEDMSNQWNDHFLKAIQHLSKKGYRRLPTFTEVKDESWECAFYIDDAYIGWDRSSRARWNNKDHRLVCCVGSSGRLEKMVRDLLFFRTETCMVPPRPQVPMDYFKDSWVYNDLLDDIWNRQGHSARRPEIGIAVYMIYDGTFYDSMTQAMLRESPGDSCRD